MVTKIKKLIIPISSIITILTIIIGIFLMINYETFQNEFVAFIGILLTFFSVTIYATITELLLTIFTFIKNEDESDNVENKKNIGIAIYDPIMIIIATIYEILIVAFGTGNFISNLRNTNITNYAILSKVFSIPVLIIIMIIFFICTLILNIKNRTEVIVKTNYSKEELASITLNSILKIGLILSTIYTIIYTILNIYLDSSFAKDDIAKLGYIFATLVPLNMVLISIRLLKKHS